MIAPRVVVFSPKMEALALSIRIRQPGLGSTSEGGRQHAILSDVRRREAAEHPSMNASGCQRVLLAPRASRPSLDVELERITQASNLAVPFVS